ncbi:MAG: GTP-binding protein [Sulfurimonas sp.]|nr:GTP-binding protein [Sulfurimonas sp.]
MKIYTIFFILLHTSLLASFDGRIIDTITKEPIFKAKISDSSSTVYSDKNGFFSINSEEDNYSIKAYGYRPFSFSKNLSYPTMEIEPIKIKALYLNFWGARITSKTFKRIIDICDETEINSVVIDIKSVYGHTVYKTSFEKANSYGAWYQRTIKDIEEFMNILKEKNIYTIARIATFKDDLQALNNPEYAIRDSNGSIWRNHDNIAWVDPYNKKSHIYAMEIAKDAAKVGFDEINFDFIRFPARRGLVYSKEDTQENRVQAISDFLEFSQNELRQYGVFTSVNTYGNICWTKDDTGIGQTVVDLAKHADYLSPMLYPSGFASGFFGLENPSEHPHVVIYSSINQIIDIIEPKRIRPWLQHFKDYTSSAVFYRQKEIKEQIRATDEHNTSGWMMWSPSSRYISNYFQKNIKADKNLTLFP